jgi:hypothetical protein
VAILKGLNGGVMWIYDCLRPGAKDQTTPAGTAEPADTSLTPIAHFSILSRSFSPTRIKSENILLYKSFYFANMG